MIMTIADRPVDKPSAAASSDWWLALLGRLDAALPDDLGTMTPATRQAAVARVWADQQSGAGSALALAGRHATDPGLRVAHQRYARLLALFAGWAGVDDDHESAAAAGDALIAELSPGPCRQQYATYPG